jgi:hypothetical protein
MPATDSNFRTVYIKTESRDTVQKTTSDNRLESMNLHLMQEISRREKVIVISTDFERINMALTGVIVCCKLIYVNAWMKTLFPTTYDKGGEITVVLHFAANRLEALVLFTINIQASLLPASNVSCASC